MASVLNPICRLLSIADIVVGPEIFTSLLAARLEDLPESALALAGQGLRDTTRIAASDPRLWAAIVVGLHVSEVGRNGNDATAVDHGPGMLARHLGRIALDLEGQHRAEATSKIGRASCRERV